MSYPVAKHRATGGAKKGYVKDTPIYRASIDFVGRVILPHRTTPRHRLERNAMQDIRSGQSTAESITSRLGLMRQSKSYAARQRVVREALRLGYTVDPRGTKVFDYVQR